MTWRLRYYVYFGALWALTGEWLDDLTRRLFGCWPGWCSWSWCFSLVCWVLLPLITLSIAGESYYLYRDARDGARG